MGGMGEGGGGGGLGEGDGDGGGGTMGERGKGPEQQISNKVKNYLSVHLYESGIAKIR